MLAGGFAARAFTGREVRNRLITSKKIWELRLRFKAVPAVGGFELRKLWNCFPAGSSAGVYEDTF